MIEDEVVDEKIMKMLSRTSEIHYTDDSEYYQFFERKKLNEDSWREVYAEDNVAYKAIKSKFLLTEDKKKVEVILQRDHDDVDEGDENGVKKGSGVLNTFTGLLKLKVKAGGNLAAGNGEVELELEEGEGREKRLNSGEGRGVKGNKVLIDYSDSDLSDSE